MKIVFCTIHVRRSSQAVPLAAGCLAVALPGRLRKQVALIDAFPDQTPHAIAETILNNKPDTVLFPVYTWNRQQVIEVAHQLHKEKPQLQLVAGGPEATGNPAGLIKDAPWAAVVAGEGEVSICELCEMLTGNTEKRNTAQITWTEHLRVQSDKSEAVYDLEKADSPWLTGTLQPTPDGGVLWEVARGCAFSCEYCFDARGHAGVRHVPRKRLEAELEYFIERGVSQVWVLDSTFNYPPERGITLLEMLHEKAPQLHYHLEAKADFLDRRTISLLGRLNCSVQIGLQSVHEKVLKSIHRPLDLDILAEKIHILNAEGVTYGFDLIYGLPGDNYAGFRSSIDAALSFSPNHLHMFPLSVLPGTRLAQQRDCYGIQAMEKPPYELISSNDWSQEEMLLCRRLAAAVDIFYNTGRAVGFFPAILDALQVQSSKLFEDFFKWALDQPEINYDFLMDADHWSAEDVYRMQQGFLTRQLQDTGQGHLVSIFLDLLCYHYHYAETLLGEELLPATEEHTPTEHAWDMAWQRSPRFRLVPFAYEILDLLEIEELHLEEIATLFRPVGSVALFMRRGNEVFCESLGEEMQLLLKQSNGNISPKEIFAGSLPQRTGEELVRFAVSEGLLLQPQASAT